MISYDFEDIGVVKRTRGCSECGGPHMDLAHFAEMANAKWTKAAEKYHATVKWTFTETERDDCIARQKRGAAKGRGGGEDSSESSSSESSSDAESEVSVTSGTEDDNESDF